MAHTLGRGWFQLGRWRGIPVDAHWTLLLTAFVFGGFRWVPVFWLGFAIVILIHELGHAVLVRRNRLWVDGIVIHGLGGECRYGGRVTERQEAVIAWGGVLAQALLYIATRLVVAVLGYPRSWIAGELYMAFGYANLIVAAFNLIPYGRLDGAKAWPLLGQTAAWRAVRTQWKRIWTWKAERNERARLARLEESVQATDDAQPDEATTQAVNQVIARALEKAKGRD